MIVDARRIRSFDSATAFEEWLSKHHHTEPELWIKIHKKGSGRPTVTHLEAIDVVLCWGWIDGLRKGFDEHSFLQRYTPRNSRSAWSQINQENISRLIAAKRMTKHGQREIDLAKKDGRWAAAYAPVRHATMETVPTDARQAIAANRKAQAFFETLDRANLFALAFRVNHMKTAEGRARKIAAFVKQLAAAKPIVPKRLKKAVPAKTNYPTKR